MGVKLHNNKTVIRVLHVWKYDHTQYPQRRSIFVTDKVKDNMFDVDLTFSFLFPHCELLNMNSSKQGCCDSAAKLV